MILYLHDYIIIFLLLVIVALEAFKIYLGLNLSVQGATLALLNGQIHKYQVENSDLKAQYLRAASYHTIEQKAIGMGLTQRAKEVRVNGQ